MEEPLHFQNREEFRHWLADHCRTSPGVWLLFSKSKALQTLKAKEALEVALCYGWIDGVMKKIDENSYIKYFSERRKNSKWSVRNKALVEKLAKEGELTDFGREKVAEAKENGQWENARRPSDMTTQQIATIMELIAPFPVAYENFQKMSPSVKKTYTRAYFDAKTDEGRQKRLAWMVQRLEQNLKPM